jgi:hypothetical protein
MPRPWIGKVRPHIGHVPKLKLVIVTSIVTHGRRAHAPTACANVGALLHVN